MFIINVTRSERKGKSYNSTHKITTLCPISLNLSLCLTFNTLISHVRTSPRWKWEKFSTGAAAKAQSRVARVDWADGVSVEWSREPFFQEKAPVGLSMVQECAGATPASADRAPPQVRGSCQHEENTPSGHTVTGADVVVHVRHSFHFLRYAIDSLAGWH